MRTALPANTKTWPNVVSMLVQRRWRWANSETALGQILAFLGSTQVSVYTHPSPTIIFSPADQGTFSKTAGRSQAYYNTWNWEWGTYDVNHLHILTCEVAVSRVGSVVWHVHNEDTVQSVCRYPNCKGQIDKRHQVLYHPPHEFLWSQIFKKSTCGGHLIFH